MIDKMSASAADLSLGATKGKSHNGSASSARAAAVAAVDVDPRRVGPLGRDARDDPGAVPPGRRRQRAHQAEHVGAGHAGVDRDQAAQRRTHDRGVAAIGERTVVAIDARLELVGA
jgi:hypothetical protein